MSFRERLNAVLGDKKRIVAVVFLAVLGLALIFASAPSDTPAAAEEETLDEYKKRLESELADICSSVEGVGRCRVMVSFERGAENTYKGGALVESRPPKVMGVTVVCAGGDRAEVRAALSSLVTSLFGVGANRVSVARLKN